MKAVGIVAISVLGLYILLRIAVSTINSHNASWQFKQEQIATKDFFNNRKPYEDLLRRWTQLFPAKCGGPAPMSGQVAFESISTIPDGKFSLDINGNSFPNLTTDVLARHLETDPQNLRSLGESLSAVNSNQIMQSGEAVKIRFLINDTHGILHVDSTCPNAAYYGTWGGSADYPGSYLRMRGLGNGWYYFVEQR